MDLSSHGRKRSSKDADDGSERDDESEQKRRMQSDKAEHTKSVGEKEKKDTASIETKKYTDTLECDSVNVLPQLFQPSSFHPMTQFPSPYDLSMNIHELRKTESYHPKTKMPPPFSSHIKPYLQRMSVSQAFPSPQAKATQMHSTYSSQQEFLPVLSSSQETRLVSSTVTSSTSSNQASLPSTSQHQQPSHPIHFHKGSLIQLASGRTKKVEELETEDFISSARSNPDVTIDHSTLVKIETDVAPGCVALTFSVGMENLMVTVSAAEEHPFFVFGGSWSSITPAQSMARYNLPCTKLSVGDVCISLTNSPNLRPPMPPPENREDMTETLQVSSPDTLTSVGSEVLAKQSEMFPMPTIHSPVTRSLSESTSDTYSVSRPSSSSSELSVTVSVATGLNTGRNKSETETDAEEEDVENLL